MLERVIEGANVVVDLSFRAVLGDSRFGATEANDEMAGRMTNENSDRIGAADAGNTAVVAANGSDQVAFRNC